MESRWGRRLSFVSALRLACQPLQDQPANSSAKPSSSLSEVTFRMAKRSTDSGVMSAMGILRQHCPTVRVIFACRGDGCDNDPIQERPRRPRRALPVKKILDLGCGSGRWPERLGTRPDDAVLIGVDISHDACVRASQKSEEFCWTCVCARGEQLPLRDASMDFVISTVAMPYMNIPSALSEIRRVLKPGGSLDVSLHTLSFTWSDFRGKWTLKPSKLLYRLYVFANGFWFHLTGNVMRCPFSSRVESWQSQRGMKISLQRAGLANIHCGYLSNGRFFVQAIHPIPLPVISTAASPGSRR